MKKQFIDYLATAGLIMILTVQVMHTTGLYLTYTRLEGLQAQLMGYFLSITIEMLVFIFIYKGSEAAGAWFAVLLFFAGILFNDNWEGSRLRVDVLNYRVYDFYLPLKFVSSTLLQFMSSVGIWYLSALHAQANTKQNLSKQISEQSKELTNLSKRVQELSKMELDLENSTKHLTSIVQERRTSIAEANTRLTEIENSIYTLKKQKAGMSRMPKE